MGDSGAPEFDIAAAAGWYSAIAGLLAGFALLAVLLPLDHEAAEDSVNDRAAPNAVIVFTCAFFSLLILSFTYAVLSGRPPGLAAATVVPFIGRDILGGQWFHHATVATAAIGTTFFATVAWLSR